MDTKLNKVLVAVVCALAPAMALASEIPRLFSEPAASGMSIPAAPGAISARVVAVESALLTEAAPRRVMADLPGGPVVLVRDRIESHSEGRWSWFGSVEREPFSTVIFLVDHREVLGGIHFADRNFRLRPEGDLAILIEAGEEDLGCGGAIEADASETIAPAPLDPAPAAAMTTAVNLLFLYTQAAEDQSPTYWGTNITNAIQQAVNFANTAATNSGAAVAFANVGAFKTTYVESGTLATDLYRLTTTPDGYMDDVLVQQAGVAADVPILITGAVGSTAQGYILTSVTLAQAPGIASAIPIHGLLSGIAGALPHELGHNMGLRHDWYVDTGTTPYLYAHGYCQSPGSYRDLMSYSDGCPSNTQILYYSNPLISYAGNPIGIAEGGGPQPADGVRALGNTAPTVGTFRTYLNTCTLSLSETSFSATYAAGSRAWNVYAGAGCRWTASSNAGWATIAFPSGYNPYYGSGGIQCNYTENTAGSNRTATITVTLLDGPGGAQTYTLTQAPNTGGCTASVNPTGSEFFTTAGGTGAFALTVNSQSCSWSVSNGLSWLTITSATSGTGNGTVTYTVAANSGSMRTGYIYVNSGSSQAAYAVAQQGRSCPVSLTPASATYSSAGGASSFGVTESNGCGWSATSYDGWLVVTSGASGSGAGTVSYSVAATGSTSGRTGSIVVDTGAGSQTFVVMQNGVGQTCNYTTSAFPLSWDDDGGASAITITTNTGCAWSAVSNDSWISFTSATGSGSGSSTMTVDANLSPASRTGTVAIAGTTYTISQEAYDSSGGGTTPTITSISSKKKKPDTTANINGTNFSANKTSNTVYFGKYMATIKTASTTKLKVTIPSKCKSGKTYQVYVKTNGISSNKMSFKLN